MASNMFIFSFLCVKGLGVILFKLGWHSICIPLYIIITVTEWIVLPLNTSVLDAKRQLNTSVLDAKFLCVISAVCLLLAMRCIGSVSPVMTLSLTMLVKIKVSYLTHISSYIWSNCGILENHKPSDLSRQETEKHFQSEDTQRKRLRSVNVPCSTDTDLSRDDGIIFEIKYNLIRLY